MTKAFSILKAIKESGMRRQPASLGIKTYNTHREQSFYGTDDQVAEVLGACILAGFQPVKIPNTKAREVRFTDGRYLTAVGGYVTYLTPKAHKSYSGAYYD